MQHMRMLKNEFIVEGEILWALAQLCSDRAAENPTATGRHKGNGLNGDASAKKCTPAQLSLAADFSRLTVTSC